MPTYGNQQINKGFKVKRKKKRGFQDDKTCHHASVAHANPVLEYLWSDLFFNNAFPFCNLF